MGYRDEMVNLTTELIRVDTSNPPGQGYEACAAVLERHLRELDLEPEVVVPELPGREPGPCLSASWGTGDRALYLHGHYDVVPAQRAAQFMPSWRTAGSWVVAART